MLTASIVTYNHHLLDIEPVLRSLMSSCFDIIYIVDHSDKFLSLEGEIEVYTQKMGWKEGVALEYISHHNNGYGGGHNIAIRKAISAGAKYHLVINPDVWFPDGTIEKIVSFMEANPTVGQVMPKILFPDGNIQRLAKRLPSILDIAGRFCFPHIIRKRNEWYELRETGYKEPLSVPYLSGCFMFFRLDYLENIGLFDERFFMYAEDIDVTRRMHARYGTVYFPEVIAFHKFNRASHRSLKLFYIHVKNLILYFNKWGWFKDEERDRFNNEIKPWSCPQ